MAKKTDKFTYGKDDQLEIFDADGKPIKSGKGKADKGKADKGKNKSEKKDKKAALAKFLSSNPSLVGK